MTAGVKLTARWDSWCRARKCRRSILRGEQIVRIGKRTYHVACAPEGKIEDRIGPREVVTDGKWEERADLA